MATNFEFTNGAEPAAIPDLDIDSMVPAKVRKELDEAGEQIAEHMRNAGLHNHDRARNLWQSALASGDTDQVLKFGSREGLQRTFEQVRSAQRSMARDIWARRVKPHVEGVRRKIIPEIEKELAKAEAAERSLCEQYGVPWSPGPAVLGLQAALHRAETSMPHQGCNPCGWFCLRAKKGGSK